MARLAVQKTTESVVAGGIEFLMRTPLLQATPDDRKRQMLLAMKPNRYRAGKRIITQGEEGDLLYVLQSGSCIVNLEKNGELHPISRLKSGDIFGELSLVTGEYRSANVDAETDVTVWTLEKKAFGRICDGCQDVVEFLTELATERLCSRKITAEKSVGRYKITDVIAEGGWSIVYKGSHSILRQPVAVKMLKHNMALYSEFFHTFRKEAETIASLNHENIVRVYDIEHVYKTLFIIMEYLSGITLRRIIGNGFKMPLSRIVHILTQVCTGLKYAHKQGIVHQDVKPGNIFLQPDDRVKIVDFGLAAPIGGCSEEMLGTPYYMAPEQIEGEPVDARTDIYSLGITAYEMATGKRPYPDDICRIMEYHITKTIPDPRECNPDLPEQFAQFVKKATEKRPAARFQCMAEVLDRLREMLGSRAREEKRSSRDSRKMISLFMFYEKDRELELDRILDEFGEKLHNVGVELRLASFDEP